MEDSGDGFLEEVTLRSLLKQGLAGRGGRDPGGSDLGWGHVTTWGQFVGQDFPSPRLSIYLGHPYLGALGREEELLRPVVRLWSHEGEVGPWREHG